MAFTANKTSDIVRDSASLSLPRSAISHSKLSRSQQAFWGALCIALLLCWSPIKSLGYAAPLLVWGWYFVFAQKRATLVNLWIWAAVWLFVICIHIVFSPGFAIPSALLAIITYSSFLILPTISSKDINGQRLWNRTIHLLSWVILFEGALGIVQAVYGYTQTGSFAGVNGDYVEGTLHPALHAELSFSNPMFATNMTFLLLALTPSVILRKKYRFAFLIGALALTLASVLHVLYLLMGALAIAILLYFPSMLKFRSGLLLAVTGTLFVAIVLNIVGFRLDIAETFFRSNIEGRTPRGVVQNSVFSEMPQEYPLLPLVGIGPGQFSSRAGLIGTGLYFGSPENPRSLPLMPIAMSPAFKKYMFDAWVNFPRTRSLSSSSTRPYFSWLSVYVEFGGIGFALIVAWLVGLLWSLRRYARTSALRIHSIILGAGILLLFLLGMQENYWEIPQAILVGLLLMKLQYANLRALYHEHMAGLNSTSYGI